MKKIISLLMPIIIAILTTVEINSLLDKKIEVLSKQRNISLIGSKFPDTIKDKSSLDKKLLSDNGDLFLLGSSELGISVPQNSLRLFPVRGADYNVSCFGRAFVQDLQQATYLGAGDIRDNQKAVFMFSIQWFEEEDGVEPYNFAVNFSEVQFYDFLNNSKISEENKKYYAERVYELLTKAKKFPAEAYYAKLYLNTSQFTNIQKFLFAPYYKIKEYLLNIQDKALIYEKIKKLPDRNNRQTLRTMDWVEEYKNIEKENEKIVSTNQFNLDDKYYNTNLKGQIGQHKDEAKSEKLLESKEIDDYKFFLSVCKELNIKPYIVLQPVNGWYYDYTGLYKEQRDQIYENAKKMAEDGGFDVLDLHDYDYEKYFLEDPKHLGKEGWLKVSEGIYKYFNKQ